MEGFLLTLLVIVCILLSPIIFFFGIIVCLLSGSIEGAVGCLIGTCVTSWIYSAIFNR